MMRVEFQRKELCYKGMDVIMRKLERQPTGKTVAVDRVVKKTYWTKNEFFLKKEGFFILTDEQISKDFEEVPIPKTRAKSKSKKT